MRLLLSFGLFDAVDGIQKKREFLCISVSYSLLLFYQEGLHEWRSGKCFQVKLIFWMTTCEERF